MKRWHQCHERENKEQLQQEHEQGQNPTPTEVDKVLSPGDLHVALHHRLRQQLLGLDLDSVLESLAAVVAEEKLLHIFFVTGLARPVGLDARGGRQLPPSRATEGGRDGPRSRDADAYDMHRCFNRMELKFCGLRPSSTLEANCH